MNTWYLELGTKSIPKALSYHMPSAAVLDTGYYDFIVAYLTMLGRVWAE